MQLGTRWPVGADVPSRLPESVVLAVQQVEAELARFGSARLDTSGWLWTLTWLEGKPVVELDDGTIIRVDPASGEAVIVEPGDTGPDDTGPDDTGLDDTGPDSTGPASI